MYIIADSTACAAAAYVHTEGLNGWIKTKWHPASSSSSTATDTALYIFVGRQHVCVSVVVYADTLALPDPYAEVGPDPLLKQEKKNSPML